jgi:hypothetical protein
MAGDDRLHLLKHTSSISQSSPKDRESRWVEMINFDSSDISTQKNPLTLEYAPTYSSTWERDVEDDGQKDSKSLSIGYYLS